MSRQGRTDQYQSLMLVLIVNNANRHQSLPHFISFHLKGFHSSPLLSPLPGYATPSKHTPHAAADLLLDGL